MRGARLARLVAISSACLPGVLYGQFTDPRTYSNAPVGVNQLELDYAYAHADASLDPSLVVAGAHLDVSQGAVAYTRTFGLLQRMAWVKATVPFAYVSGSVPGAGISRSVSGAGDASLEIAALLMGGPALGVADFASYQPTTTLGAGLTVTGPTGKYDPDRLLNLGSDRWSFKPQIAIAQPFGREQEWEVDGYVNAYFFTASTTYRGREVLRQEPLFGAEAHLSRNFGSQAWASLDASYSFRGATAVDSVDQHDPQKNLTVGTEASWSPNARNSFALVLAKSVVHENAPAYTGVAIKYFRSD